MTLGAESTYERELRPGVPGKRASLAEGWRGAWADPRFRWSAVATPILLFGTLRLYSVVLNAIERRPGVVLADPVLEHIAPRDVSGLTFAIVYGVILVGVAQLIRHPRLLVLGTQAYALMVVLRMVALFLLPLDPPPDLIPLHDPFAEHVAVGSLLTRDLFFSGHTATVFLFALGVPGRWTRCVFALCTAAVAGCVLLQHVHYTVDVAVAPLASYAAYRIASWINERANYVRIS